MRELADVVETLHLEQHIRVMRGRVLQERPDVTLKIVQKPRKVNQFSPRTAQHVGEWKNLLPLGVLGNEVRPVGSRVHDQISAAREGECTAVSARPE